MKRTVETEKFFTSPALARRCVEMVERRYGIDSFEFILEPSAGGGAFLEHLPQGPTTVAIDLEPSAAGIASADFFEWSPPAQRGRTLVIGNPPFGQRCALACRFLEKACWIGDVVAFILPRSFNKYTFQNRVDPWFHLVDRFDCSEFEDPHGSPLDVNAVFQIWERRSEKRVLDKPRKSHPHFRMTHRHLSRTSDEELREIQSTHPFALPQVGAAFRPRPSEDLSRGSHWFISPNVPRVRERFEKLDFSFLDGMNTAHKSLSKADIVRAYETVLDAESDTESSDESISTTAPPADPEQLTLLEAS